MMNKILKFVVGWSLTVFIIMTILTTIESNKRYSLIIELTEEVEQLKKEKLEISEEKENYLTTVKILNDKLHLITEKYKEEKENFFERQNKINITAINESSGYSLKDIELLVKGTELEEIAYQVFISGRAQGINELFIISVAQLESAHGTSSLSRHKNNIFGLNAWGKTGQEIFERAFQFETKSESVSSFVNLIVNNYFSNGRTTIYKIGEIYAEDPLWGEKVYRVFQWNVERIERSKNE